MRSACGLVVILTLVFAVACSQRAPSPVSIQDLINEDATMVASVEPTPTGAPVFVEITAPAGPTSTPTPTSTPANTPTVAPTVTATPTPVLLSHAEYGGYREFSNPSVEVTNEIERILGEDRQTLLRYTTNARYDSLARRPREYFAEKITISGKVIETQRESNGDVSFLRLDLDEDRPGDSDVGVGRERRPPGGLGRMYRRGKGARIGWSFCPSDRHYEDD